MSDEFETTVPLLLTVTRTATVLGCSPRTVRRRIHKGALPAVIEGDRTMVRGDDLKHYIDALERVKRNGWSKRPPRRPMPRSYDFLS